MEKNWIIINGYIIAIDSDIQIQSDSPLNDKTYVYYAGNKISVGGEASMPFTITMNRRDLAAIGFPHLLQNTNANNQRITGVLLYSDGVLINTGSLIFTSITRNIDMGKVKCECLFFDPVEEFIDAINIKNVNDLVMDGTRTINETTNYLTGPAVPERAYVNVNNSNIPTDPQYYLPYAAIVDPSGLDMRGCSTSDYATQIALNGDPNADLNGDYICFPTVYMSDNSKGDSWLNFWDPQYGAKCFTSYKYTSDLTSPTCGQNTYSKYVVSDLGNHVVPMYYYHQIIRHCFSENGYTLIDEAGFLSDPHFKRLVLTNTFDILNAMTVTMQNSDGSNVRTVGYYQRTTYIAPYNHLPIDTIQSFLLDFMVKFNCYFEFTQGKAYLRVGDFMTIDREIADIAPEDKIENTLDTGCTIGYEFPSDTRYDIIKQIPDITDTSRVKVFKAGVNDVFAVPTINDAFLPAYYPQIAGQPNVIILAEDENMLYYIVDGGGAQVLSDNVMPIIKGVDKDPVNPRLNLNEVTQDNSQSYSLKYPPVNSLNYIPTLHTYPGVAYQLGIASSGTSVSEVTPAIGNLTFTTQPLLNLATGDVVIVTAILSGLGIGYMKGTVLSYFTNTGQIVINITYIDSTLALAPFNNWVIAVDDLHSYYVRVPVMGAEVSTKPTQDYMFKQCDVYGGSDANQFAPIGFINGSWFTDDGQWVTSLALPINTYMPSAWITRDTSTVFETGFYWGIYETTDLVGTGWSIPVMNNNTGIWKNTSVTPGWFTMSILGPYGIPAVFWKGFINQFIFNRKITFTAYEPIFTTRGHKFYRAVMVRGTKVYISQINYKLPTRYNGAEYVGYLI